MQMMLLRVRDGTRARAIKNSRPYSSAGRALDYKTNPVVTARVRVASALASFALGGDGLRSVVAAAIVVR